MTQRSDRPNVGHSQVVDRLVQAWDAADAGPHTAIVAGAPGSGRTTAGERFLAALGERGDSFAQLRLKALPADDGVRTLMRIYGSFVAGLGRGKGFGDTSPADLLESAASATEDERVKGWLTEVAEGVRGVRAASASEFQIKLPRHNPWLALLYAFDVVGPRARWLIDLHDLAAVTSPSFWAFLSALVGRARARSWKVLFVVAPGENLYSEKPGKDDEANPGPGTFLQSLFGDGTLVEVPPLLAADVAEFVEDTYRPHRFPEGLAERLHRMSGGHPDTLHQLLDALEEDETITWDDKGFSLSDLDDVDLEVLVPLALEEDDDDDDDSADADDDDDDDDSVDEGLLERVLHVAAIEGRTFSASAIRTVLQAGEDEIDDALDAMPHIVEEGQYHQALGTWTYKFRYDFWRIWFRDHPPESIKAKPDQIARGLATVMMQSYAPAAFEYVARAARLFTFAGESRGARNMLGLALGADRPELAQFALETIAKFEDSPWPPGLIRLLHTRLADRAVNGGTVEFARATLDAARAWAESADDLHTLAFLQLLACRLAIREGDFATARTLGERAHAQFDKIKDQTRAGETLNQLAMVALNLGDPKAAEAYVKRAGKTSNIPPVKAHSQYILGLLLKRRGQVQQANGRFDQAVTLSEQAGNLVLSLEAMLNRGECGMMLGEGAKLAPMLERALEMSRALRSPARERIAARLLCQAEAARGNPEAAYEMAKHALELTREVAKGQGESVDLYHCGLFAVLAGKTDEGLDYLTGARTAAEQENNPTLVPEILFNVGQVKMSNEDWTGGEAAFEQALGLARGGKDKSRELRILEHLGLLLSLKGDLQGAITRWKEASDKAVGPQSKDFRKDLRRRISEAQKRAASPPP